MNGEHSSAAWRAGSPRPAFATTSTTCTIIRNRSRHVSATGPRSALCSLLVGGKLLGSAGGPRHALPLLTDTGAARFSDRHGDTTDVDLDALADRTGLRARR